MVSRIISLEKCNWICLWNLPQH